MPVTGVKISAKQWKHNTAQCGKLLSEHNGKQQIGFVTTGKVGIQVRCPSGAMPDSGCTGH